MDELMNNNLINVNFNTLTVSARDLHDGLEIKSNFTTWFNRMCEYGFNESDYMITWSDSKNGNAIKFEKSAQYMSSKGYIMDAQISVEMAKQICMLQRSEKGKQYREYFLAIEKAWNTPEQVMARALKLADRTINDLKYQIEVKDAQIETQRQEITAKEEVIEQKTEQIKEMKPKATYFDRVMQCSDLLPVTSIAKDYGWSAAKLNRFLKDRKVQFKLGNVWYLYQKYAEKGYASTKTNVYFGKDGQDHAKAHMYWTQKGRLFIYTLMKQHGVLPIMERD